MNASRLAYLPVTVRNLEKWCEDSPKDPLNNYWRVIWYFLEPSYNSLKTNRQKLEIESNFTLSLKLLSVN